MSSRSNEILHQQQQATQSSIFLSDSDVLLKQQRELRNHLGPLVFFMVSYISNASL